ncbi:MAG: SIS domain-containing protein [Candidatus Kapaibacterium sp.]
MDNDLKNKISDSIAESITIKTRVLEECIDQIGDAAMTLSGALGHGKKVLLCGNGGSAADAQHIAAELVVRFRSSVERPALPAIALTVDPSIMTAGGNDYGFDEVFARATEAYGAPGDVLIGISTSGNSRNVIRAIETAKSKGMKTIALIGGEGGKMAGICDCEIIVPGSVTARIQESHIMIAHILCELIEEMLFPDKF